MQVMTVTTPIRNSTLRELRTALEAWRKAEYTGGRERAAQYLASVASDLLTGALIAIDAQCAVSEVYYDDTAEVRRAIVAAVGEPKDAALAKAEGHK